MNRMLSITAPQNDLACARSIAQLGEAMRERDVLEAAMNEKLDEIRGDFQKDVGPIDRRIKSLRQGIQAFCDANRERLTRGGKVKFHAFTSGEVRWRKLPPKVVFDVKQDKVVDYLIENAVWDFLRRKHEVDREKMLADPAQAVEVPGVRIESEGEQFVIAPRRELIEPAEASADGR